MTSNRMYLVCTHHPDQRDALLLAERSSSDSRYFVSSCRCLGKCECSKNELRSQQKWFETHADCGGTHDHFTVAFEMPKDHDIHVEAAVNGAHA